METRIPVPGLHAAPAAPAPLPARDAGELDDDDLDAVAGGLARAWTGAPGASAPVPTHA